MDPSTHDLYIITLRCLRPMAWPFIAFLSSRVNFFPSTVSLLSVSQHARPFPILKKIFPHPPTQLSPGTALSLSSFLCWRLFSLDLIWLNCRSCHQWLLPLSWNTLLSTTFRPSQSITATAVICNNISRNSSGIWWLPNHSFQPKFFSWARARNLVSTSILNESSLEVYTSSPLPHFHFTLLMSLSSMSGITVHRFAQGINFGSPYVFPSLSTSS